MTERGETRARIHTASARLDKALAPIEAVFMGAGDDLAGAVQRLGRLTDGFADLASRLEHPDSVAALSCLEGVSGRIGALVDGTVASQDRLKAMHARADALHKRIARLRKVIGEVKVLAVNAKVEAAHVSARDVDFTVFTREIGRLADLAGNGLDRLADELTGLVDGMVRARTGLDDFNREHRQSLATVGARLTRGLADAARRRQDSARAIRGLGELSRSMAAKVAQTVEALQVGDITRQRAEHVREALATLLEVLEGAAAGGDRLPADHRKPLIANVCRLQSAQARHAAEDLRHELGRIRDNVDGLMSDLGSLPERCSAVYGGGAGGASSFLLELGRDLDDVHQLLRRYAGARAGMDQVVANITAVVEGMVHHIEDIRSIEADMRVMGLNATFRCGRLGPQGRTLSVIAQELRGYSNRTAEEGKAAMADLTDLIAAAHALGEDEQAQSAGSMDADMAAAVRKLEEMGEDASRSLAGLGAIGSHVLQALERSRGQMDSHPEFVAALVEFAAAVGAVADECGDCGDIDGIRDEVLELLRGRYTMASERKVHTMFGTDADAATEAGDGAVEDFLF